MRIRLKNRFNIRNLLIAFVLVQMIIACNPTKFVPDNMYLLNKVKLKTDNKELNKEELKAHLLQKENLKILGVLKFHLGLYSLSSKKKADDWLKRIGEAPVIYEDYQRKRSKEELLAYLRNKGYYNAEINDTVIYKTSKSKADLIFNIDEKRPYKIRHYKYSFNDDGIRNFVLSDIANQNIRVNDLFDLDILNDERERITRGLRNHGFYNFSEEFIQFMVDSSLNSHEVDITVEIDDAKLTNDDKGLSPHKRYKIRNYIINTDYVPTRLLDGKEEFITDTLRVKNCLFVYVDKLKYKPDLFFNINRIQDSTYYSLRNVEKTYRAFSRLGQFKVVNISFQEVDTLIDDAVGFLDCRLQLSALPKYGFSADVEGTNSSGNFGVAGNLNFQQRNVFHGAEVFDFKIKGAMERQQTLINNNSFDFNTQEFGFESSLTIPKFLFPLKSSFLFGFQVPETRFTFGYNYQQRPDYTRTITNLKFGYIWKTSSNQTHTFNLADINYVNLYEFNPEFIDSIKDLYIKSSFTDHLISALNYSWVYNTQNINKRSDYKFINVRFESAGNLLGLYSNLINKDKKDAFDSITNTMVSYHEALGTRFAQFVKGEFEFRYGHMIDMYNSVIGRAFLGVGLPYGNLDVLPFEKKYFTGGANGIRAWQVRSLGPGSYNAPLNAYPNQSSDIKIEANLEYRFKLLLMMEGALFLDAGNIWAIKGKDNRDGAVFYPNEFYKQIAVGTGVGLRFDFSYFIFRLDLGMKLRDPSLEEGTRWIIGNYPVNTDHFNLSFAIGYPF